MTSAWKQFSVSRILFISKGRWLHNVSALHTWVPSDMNSNPLDNLQMDVVVPLLKEKDYINRLALDAFSPSLADIELGKSFFSSKEGYTVERIAKTVHLDRLPEAATPEGFTRNIQLYQVSRLFTLVDMPGYGENMPKHYEYSVGQYLEMRKNLIHVFFLIDATTGITPEDDYGLSLMENYVRPYSVVLNKIDLTTASECVQTFMQLQRTLRKKKLQAFYPRPFLVSALTGAGVGYLQAYIAHCTGLLTSTSQQ